MRQSMYWLKLPYFSNQSCLWGNTLLQDQKSLLNKPTQSDWKGGNISSMYPTSVKYPCVCTCVWAGMSFKQVFDRCMRGPELKSWKTACVVVIGREVTALTDSSGANSDQGHDWWKQRVGWQRGTPGSLGWGGNDNRPRKEMKRIAAFGKHAVRRIWLQKRK